MNYPTRCEISDPVFPEYNGRKGIADLSDGNFSNVQVTWMMVRYYSTIYGYRFALQVFKNVIQYFRR